MTSTNTGKILAFLAIPILLIAVEIGALLLSLPVQAAGLAAFQDPSAPENLLIFLAILLAFTGLLLLLIKYDLRKVIAVVIAVTILFTFAYIFWALAVLFFGATDPAAILTLVLAALATLMLYKYPEWYVIDILGVLIAAGVASIFGISLDIIPVLILLILLAVYDAISVYKTKHMITLAEGVIDLKTPILFIVPKKKDYSFIRDGLQKLEEGGVRGALVIGMGDMVMPSILVVSANVFIGGWRLFGMVNLPAIGAMIGSLAGLVLLLHFVNSGKPQAGLPPLNGGTILGFITGLALAAAL